MSTPNMGLTLPTDHGSADVWDTILDTVFGLIDAHDHTTGKGVKVPSAGLNINADISWASGGSNFAISDLRALDFVPKAASTVAALADALFSNSDDANNLYWRNHSGTNVRITNGATLDVTLVGGIGGDYTSVGALFSFDDATDSYWAQQQGGPRPWARLRVGDVDIYQTAASIVNRVRLQSPAALAASYALTLPPTLPASPAFLQSTAAGVMTLSNTITQPVTATDQRYTTAQELFLGAQLCLDRLGTHTKLTGATSLATNRIQLAASANPLVWPIPCRVGDTITGYTVRCRKLTNNTNTIAARIFNISGTTGIENGGAGLGAGSSSAANAPGYITLSETGLTAGLAANTDCIYLVFTPGGGITPAPDEVLFITVNVTRP